MGSASTRQVYFPPPLEATAMLKGQLEQLVRPKVAPPPALTFPDFVPVAVKVIWLNAESLSVIPKMLTG